ncbi:MAG: DUF262 domain-containing protein [Porphyrobacter sp.]|nr:DUF262 domain-containing protein [Porphyrobacter sp.]
MAKDEPTADEDLLEQEGVGELPEDIREPFDPAQIKISRRVVPINLIVDRIKYNEIDLQPEFQRKARIWDRTRKSRLIESIMLRIPLPVFYVASDENENWRVVDGLQRLTTIYDFISQEIEHNFRLKGLEYLTPFEDAAYNDLPRSIKRRIDETEINVNVIESGTPETVMFNIFRRLNTGGISLNSQEIRNALHPGPVRDFLKELVALPEFHLATDGGVRDERMGARELALRFCAFRLTSFRYYNSADLDGFLNEAMRKINCMDETGRGELLADFREAMVRSHQLFGENAFRRTFSYQPRRSPINRALFESTAVPILDIESLRFRRMATSRELYQQKFYDLLIDDRFNRAISLSTGSRSAVIERFQSMSRFFESGVS